MIITGGSTTATTVSVYSVQGWLEDLPPLSIGRINHACAGYTSGGRTVRFSLFKNPYILNAVLLQMFIVSGGFFGSDYLDSTEIFDPSIGSWRAGAALPRGARDQMRAINIDNRILIFGIQYPNT